MVRKTGPHKDIGGGSSNIKEGGNVKSGQPKCIKSVGGV